IREELREVRQRIRQGRMAGDLSLNTLKELGKQITEVEERVQERPPGESLEAQRKKARRLRLALEEGDTVLVKTLGTTGTVIALAKKEAEVAIGRMKTRVPLTDLELRERAEEEVEEGGVMVNLSNAPSMELDLRGKRVEEGLAMLENYLDSAYLSNLPWARIIHGKGTGRMKVAVRQALQKNQHVLSFEERSEERRVGKQEGSLLY